MDGYAVATGPPAQLTVVGESRGGPAQPTGHSELASP